MKSSKILLSSALILGIVIMANLLISQFYFRFDLTEDRQYTLSKATKTILSELEEPITVKAYFSENLTPQIANIKTEFRELLQEYSELADGNLVYEFVNPDENEESKTEAQQAGVAQVAVSVREKNEIKQQQAFMGAQIQMGEESDVIPFLQPGSPYEYLLTTSIKKLSVLDKPAVGLIQGHGEPSIQEMVEVNSNLSILYSFEPLNLRAGEPISDRYQTLALVRPTDSIPPAQLQLLDDFLGRGGKLFIAMNRVDADLSVGSGNPVNTGLETWLQEKGLEIANNFVVDATCGTVSVRQQQGFFTMLNQIQFPYIPIIQSFADHPITKGLEAAVFQFVSEMRFVGDSSVTFSPIAFSSDRSGTQSVPIFIDAQKNWIDSDFPRAGIPLAGVLEGNIVGSTYSKMVVIADGDFPINGSQQGQYQQLQGDNGSLMVNSIDWLSDDTGLIDLRTKGVISRPIDQLEEGQITFLKYLNFLLPILLVILYGVFRAQRRKRIRSKRENESYA